MSEKDNKGLSKKEVGDDQSIDSDSGSPTKENSPKKEFDLGTNPLSISSAESLNIPGKDEDILSLRMFRQRGDKDIPQVEKKPDGKSETDPVFRELAEPKLPNLPRENRARLQMQSPTRLYFYWSVKTNPFQTLNKAFGGKTGSYILVAKLVDRSKNTEELFPVDPEGNWWFNVNPDSNYRAEIGFYAPNRPYVRIMFSNEIQTPRKSPSKRTDYTPSFHVSAAEFSGVLDVAGYRRDAVEVAIAGDDLEAADTATRKTYVRLVGKSIGQFDEDGGDEIRFALLALASGYSIEDIRSELSSSLFATFKSDLDKLSREEVLAALTENFDIFTDEFIEEEEFGTTVFGASIVNFPKRLKKRNVPKTLVPKFSTSGSLSKLLPLSSSEFVGSSSNLK